MFIYSSVFLIILSHYSGQLEATMNAEIKKPTIFIAVLARNKEPTLPYFLSLLEEQDYPKDRISLWIRSDHNVDSTVKIIETWLNSVKNLYHSINSSINQIDDFEDEISPTHWSVSRFNHVIKLREEALNTARNKWADFILFLDCDIFLTNKQTLQYLVSQGHTVIAPMLKSVGLFSNFWCGMTPNYYYLRTDDYQPILKRQRKGCFNVPMVHSAVLINMRKVHSNKLSFIPSNIESYKGPVDDIITFAISANVSGIPLYICNEERFGYIMLPLEENTPLENDWLQLTNIILEILVDNPPLEINKLLSPFVPQKSAPDKFGLDKIYMINLKRRPERRYRMVECFKELNMEVSIFDAVDGRDINDSFISEMGIQFMPEYKDPYHKRAMTHGEIGCFLSHYFIWEQVVENGYEVIMVLEDDVRFEPYFRQKLTSLFDDLNRTELYWDLIYLGRKRLEDKEDWVEGCNSLVHVAYSYWTLGYLLTLNGAKKLLEQDPLKNLIPVDEYLPILFDKHPEETWKKYFPKRNLVAFSIAPLLLYPTHYTGEEGYISDTENSEIIQSTINDGREDL